MRRRRGSRPKPDAVDALIEEVILDAHGDAEQIQAFQQVFDDRLDLPTDAPRLSGEIGSWRLDVGALGLVPLRIEDRGPWTPDEEYRGEPGEPLKDWVEAIIARGPRPAFEMEQVRKTARQDSRP